MRKGDDIDAVRVARFADGSSDEDRGKPPSLARFAGPRHFAGQEIRIE